MEISEKIKNKAYKIGFNLVGFCEPKPLKNAYNVLQERKNNNKIPKMMSKNLELLTDPKLHMKSVNTIISLALAYPVDSKNINQEAHIAFYARGRDYHRVMKEKMDRLLKFMENINENVIAETYSDTVPILEKEIARKAGLGWIGKNNLLINPVYGSYLILGEIFTNLTLDYDKPLNNGCGKCRICVEKCPTGALKKPYYLDSDLCISYLTQKKGYLTEKENHAIGNNLWGCDICQLYCPYNKNVDVKITEELKPVLDANLLEILNYKKFPDIWKNSAISWRGLETIKRNALIVMVNNKNGDYLNYLKENTDYDSALIKKYVDWASEELRSELDD